MKKPYIKKIGEFDGLKVFYVDGMYIRENLDEEFTNCAAHYKFQFIPEDEIWIDQEFGKTKEWRYFLEYYIARKRLIEEGKTIEEAKRLGNIAEQEKRDTNKTIIKLKKLSREELLKKVRLKEIKKYSNSKVKIYVVNGFIVRGIFFIDFTEGGHDKVYNFVPKNEIWIDDALSSKELKFVLIHEAHERELMNKGMSYDDSHKDSSRIEYYCRKHKKEIDKVLKEELVKQ
jgi:hypothetical protein